MRTMSPEVTRKRAEEWCNKDEQRGCEQVCARRFSISSGSQTTHFDNVPSQQQPVLHSLMAQ